MNERLFSVKEVAELLRVSVRAVYRLVAAGKLAEPVKVGNSSRWCASEINQFFEEVKRGRRSGN